MDASAQAARITMSATPHAAAQSVAPLQPPPFDPRRDALFLDLDGTLIEIAEAPDEVVADDALLRLLREVAAEAGGALALMTGRTIADADRILRGAVDCVVGLHGAECRIRPGVTLRAAEPAPAMEAIRAALHAAIAAGDLNARMEDKGMSIALHYRHAPASAAAVCTAAEALATAHGFAIVNGKMVCEILPPGRSKGAALVELARRAPFVGRRPVSVGDDVTDESAFAAAAGLGGLAVHVGAPGTTAAGFNLPNVQAVRGWLSASLRRD
jgi:trehalose 6-phosphate phosphatase